MQSKFQKVFLLSCFIPTTSDVCHVATFLRTGLLSMWLFFYLEFAITLKTGGLRVNPEVPSVSVIGVLGSTENENFCMRFVKVRKVVILASDSPRHILLPEEVD